MEHLCHLKWRPSNSMESRATRCSLFGDSRVPWNSMDYPLQVKGNMVLIEMTFSKFHGIPWNWVIFHLAHQSSMEFHGIRWNLVIAHLVALEFHGIPWNFVSLHAPWNFRSFMEFHVTSHLGLGIPWNSMEFGFIAKFHGTFKIPWNSMELLNWL